MKVTTVAIVALIAVVCLLLALNLAVLSTALPGTTPIPERNCPVGSVDSPPPYCVP